MLENITFEQLEKLAHAAKLLRELEAEEEKFSREDLKVIRGKKAAKKNYKASNRKGTKAQQRRAWLLEAE